jgi:hypothetical protein
MKWFPQPFRARQDITKRAHIEVKDIWPVFENSMSIELGWPFSDWFRKTVSSVESHKATDRSSDRQLTTGSQSG